MCPNTTTRDLPPPHPPPSFVSRSCLPLLFLLFILFLFVGLPGKSLYAFLLVMHTILLSDSLLLFSAGREADPDTIPFV